MERLGPYELVREIAVGGMAEVYLAKVSGIAGFEKYVALKMIHPNFAENDDFVQMLIDEAKLAVQLAHPNIAQTFDLGRVGETYYITMEYVEGADLHRLLYAADYRDMPFPFDAAAFIAKDVAAALDHAHARCDSDGRPLGIVHRDVSPQNVMISVDGVVKLVDFGIAKASISARQTEVGVIKGKYYYLSPEQAAGLPLDGRSDIFSAGIVLYEMITGRPIYTEDDTSKLLDLIRDAVVVPPSTLRPDIPHQLEQIVMRALAGRKDDRYRTAGELAIDLQQFLRTYAPRFVTASLRELVETLTENDPGAGAVTDTTMTTLRHVRRDELADPGDTFVDENSVIGLFVREPPRIQPSDVAELARRAPPVHRGTTRDDRPQRQREVREPEIKISFDDGSRRINIESYLEDHPKPKVLFPDEPSKEISILRGPDDDES